MIQTLNAAAACGVFLLLLQAARDGPVMVHMGSGRGKTGHCLPRMLAIVRHSGRPAGPLSTLG